MGKPGLSFEAQCEDKDITGAVLREVVNHGRISKLEKFEVIIRHNGDSDSNHDSDLTLPDPNFYIDPVPDLVPALVPDPDPDPDPNPNSDRTLTVTMRLTLTVTMSLTLTVTLVTTISCLSRCREQCA